MMRCISFDGGGVRGVMSARLLSRIIKDHGELFNHTNVFAGTSIGAYTAAGLAAGMSIDEIEDLIVRISSQTFKKNFWSKLGKAWGFQSAKYSQKYIAEELSKIFGNQTLGDLKKGVLIASFRLSKVTANFPPAWTPVFFHNMGRVSGGTSGHSKDLKIVDALLRSSAAPTYFPIYQNHIDGGIIANNPSMALLAQLVQSNVADIKDIILLSVGTGYETRHINSQNGNWGYLPWLRPGKKYGKGNLIDLVMDGPGDSNHFYTKTILKSKYHRLQIYMKDSISLCDAEKIPHLQQIADSQDLRQTDAWLKTNWVTLQHEKITGL